MQKYLIVFGVVQYFVAASIIGVANCQSKDAPLFKVFAVILTPLILPALFVVRVFGWLGRKKD